MIRILSIALLLAACERTTTRSPPPATHDAPAPEPAAPSEPAAAAVLIRNPDGHIVLVEPDAIGGAEVIVSLDADAIAKLDRPGLLRAAERGPTLDAYLRIDPARAPSSAREDLAALGFTAGTIAGDVVTGRFTLARLADVLAAPWVVRLEFASGIRARADR